MLLKMALVMMYQTIIDTNVKSIQQQVVQIQSLRVVPILNEHSLHHTNLNHLISKATNLMILSMLIDQSLSSHLVQERSFQCHLAQRKKSQERLQKSKDDHSINLLLVICIIHNTMTCHTHIITLNQQHTDLSSTAPLTLDNTEATQSEAHHRLQV